MANIVSRWLEERLETSDLIRGFLFRKVPRGVGWWYTLGSATLVSFVLLLITGLFLMMNYSPSPDHAYESVQFIMQEVTFGALIRSIHFWSASAMVVLIGLHTLRVFFMAAYKYPREITWVIGVLLFILVMGAGFTGYLLPWDQKAYWATNVGTAIAGQTPLLGPLIQQVLIGGSQIGALTLTRFFTFHVAIIPLLIMLLMGIHIFMVVKQGISAPPMLSCKDVKKPPLSPRISLKEAYQQQYQAAKEGGETFFPETISRDALVALLLVIVIVTLAIILPATSEAPADPTSTTYNPRPEWYFLFFFQFLKLFPGSLEAIAAIVIPTLAILIFGMIPFVDRGLGRQWAQRKRGIGAGVVVVLAFLTLVVMGVRSAPVAPAGEESLLVQSGRQVYKEINCAYCHNINGVGGNIGPDLSTVGGELDEEQLITYLQNPHAMVPTTLHPKLQFTEEELEALTAYLLTLGATIAYSSEAPELFGGHCSSCHIIDGKGGTLGPDLSAVGSRRSITFLESYTADPGSVLPETTMPAYQGILTPEQIQDIAAYLYSLKE